MLITGLSAFNDKRSIDYNRIHISVWTVFFDFLSLVYSYI